MALVAFTLEGTVGNRQHIDVLKKLALLTERWYPHRDVMYMQDGVLTEMEILVLEWPNNPGANLV